MFKQHSFRNIAMSVTKLKNSEQTFQELTKFMDEWHNSVSFVTQYTSGSTGKPKLIKIQKSQMIASAKMTADFLRMDKMESALLCISPKYVGGKMLIVRSLECDLDIIIGPTSANPLKDLNNPVSFAALVPLQLQTIIQDTPEKLDLIDTIIVGGAPVSKALADQLIGKKSKIYSTFGMTETISHIALKALHEGNQYFHAIGNTTFTQTESQNLVIHAPDLEISSLQTNDIVELKNPTQFKWIGRSDFIINSGGIKVSPEKIEQFLIPHIQGAFIVAGIPDEQLGEKVVIISEAKINLEQLRKITRKDIDQYSFPKEIINSPVSYTENEKIDRLQTKNNLRLEK